MKWKKTFLSILSHFSRKNIGKVRFTNKKLMLNVSLVDLNCVTKKDMYTLRRGIGELHHKL